MYVVGVLFVMLVEVGMCIVFDDFGVGFCNFCYFKILLFYYLKFDCLMVEGIIGDYCDFVVLCVIVVMVWVLELEVIVEGIEIDE